MSRQDANAAFAQTSFLYGGNADYVEHLYSRYETDPTCGRCGVAGVLPQPQGRPRRRAVKSARGPSWRRPDWPQRAGGDLVAALAGDWARDREGCRRQGRGPRAGDRRRASPRPCPAGDPRLDPRPDADPRLPGARTFPRQSRPARSRAAPRTSRTSTRAPTASPTPNTIGRSSSTACSVSNSAPCAKSSPSCAAPIARRSASSSCTSPIRRRRAGCRSASRVRTRRSASPARASARSSTSWSRRKASRNSATSSSPAPSASVSTAPSR